MRRFVHALSALAVAALGIIAVPPSASAAPVDYIALGDSYAAGPGAGNYISPVLPCYRSRNAYPELWAAANGAAFDNDTCSGATVPTVLQNQGAGLNGGTDRVTLTIGGNDVGFVSLIAACRLALGDCVRANDTARAKIAGQLPGALDQVLGFARGRAPNARVILTGYPVPYNATSLCIGGVSRQNREVVNETIRRLNGALSAAAGRNGTTWAPVTDNFEGHRLCDGGTRYLHDLGSADVLGGQYHPTAAGQRYGYLAAVSRF